MAFAVCAFTTSAQVTTEAQQTRVQLMDSGYYFSDAESFAKAFFVAASRDDTNSLQLLLKVGADAGVVTNKTAVLSEALGWAAKARKTEAVKFLIAKGAEVDARDQRGETALMCASRIGSAETVKVLIDGGAKPNETTKDGKSPLIYAAEANRYEPIKVLLENGADASIKDGAGNTALEYARKWQNTKLVDLLKSRTGAPKIDGAFGLKLGDTFDTTKGVLVKPTQLGEVRVDEYQVVYKFTPQKPLPPLESYYVEITPKAHKICSIFAVTRENLLNEKKEQLDVVVTALSNKYGKSESGWGFVLYSTEFDGKTIGLVRSTARLSEQSQVYVVTLIYNDGTLQELAKREWAELSKADKDSKQREMDNKAKALEKSGL
jgi:ankyrin repeat protein